MTTETTAQEQAEEVIPEFSKNLIIQDVARFYPEAVEIFLDYGLHCIGCHVSGMETVEEGALGHGMSEDELENMIMDAKERIEESRSKKKA